MSTIITDAVTALSGNLALAPEGSGVVTIDGLTYPAADGSANQLMKTNGSGVLSFVDAPSGGLTLIASTTISDDATIDFETTAAFDGTFDTLTFELSRIVCASNNTDFIMLVKTGGAYVTSSYEHLLGTSVTASSYAEKDSTDGIYIADNLGNDTGESLDGTVTLHAPATTGRFNNIISLIAYMDTSADTGWALGGGCFQGATTAIQGVRFKQASGNLTSGKITMYGKKTS